MAAADRADEFLNAYRELEEALNNKYGTDEKKFGSPIVRFISEKESKPFRENLDICREIRNFLSHHSEVGGERIIQPSEYMIRFLGEVTDFINQPPLALEFATLFADILKTTLSQKVQTVMKKMERQGFSHVPVIDGGECVGVFSVSTIFTYSLTYGLTSLRDDMIISDFGEMLFTHFGVSGPVILSASAYLNNKKLSDYCFSIDLKPALSEKQLDLRILRDLEAFINKDIKNSLGKLLPSKLIPVVIERAEIPINTKCNSITKEQRHRLLEILKNFTVNISGFRPIEEAIITSGGVSTKEINPKTMESKICRGLYFAGEVIDVDAYTGGFNLQIAFSTGYLAGTAVY